MTRECWDRHLLSGKSEAELTQSDKERQRALGMVNSELSGKKSAGADRRRITPDQVEFTIPERIFKGCVG